MVHEWGSIKKTMKQKKYTTLVDRINLAQR